MSKVREHRQDEWWRAERITQLGFLAILLCVLALSVLSYNGIETLQANVQHIAETYNKKNTLTQSLSRVVNHRMMMARDIVSVGDPFLSDKLVQEYSGLATRFNTYFSQLRAMNHAPEEEKLLARLENLVTGSTELRQQIRALPTAKPNIDVKVLLNRALTLNGAVHTLLNHLQEQQRKDFKNALEQAKQNHTRNLKILLFSFFLVLLIMLYIAYRVSGFVRRSNRQLTTMAMEKSMLLATMSHEIRTPLTSIIGFGETLLEIDTTKEERISAINAVVRNGRYLQGVINDILDFSKIDAGQMEYQKDTMALSVCLDDLDSMLRGRAQSKGLSFEIRVNTLVPACFETDPIKLRQILINLLANAIKFTEQGSVRLDIAYDEDASRLHFDVIDTGIGITKEKQSTLFNPYRQLSENHYEGTGLGLYISRQMAELMGGDMKVCSEPGKGSSFCLSLPVPERGRGRLVDWQQRADEKVASTGSPYGVQYQGRVLLAEDRKDNQRLFGIYLSKAGVDVDLVGTGTEALARALEHPYDIILMDVQMPEMDGITATRRLREASYNGKIIALTASQSIEDHRRCMEAGFDDFLSKPISRTDFVTILGRYLDEKPEDDVDINSPVYSELYDRDPELLPALDYFVDQLSQNQRNLGRYLRDHDWLALKELIHDLKGSAGGVGYPELSKLAMQVEFALAKNDDEEAAYLTEQVLLYIQRIQLGYSQQTDGVPTRPLNS